MNSEILAKLSLIESQLHFNEKKFFNMDEAANYLQLSKSYLYKMTYARKISFYKPNGKKIYFDKSELDEWIKRNRVKSISEIEREAINYVTIRKRG